jgi:hypothetical protein
MKDKFSYVKKEDRKKILLLADDIRLHSGIATMSREIVLGTAHRFNWVNLGGAMNHPEDSKVFDLSQEVNKNRNLPDSSVILYATSGYGTAEKVREIINREKPDAILHFTDPRYWTWLYDIEREIRQQMPLMYLNIWDNYPAPLYNKSFYECCDLLMGISKQTVNINNIVLGDIAKEKLIKYVPHGINEEHFYPIQKDTQEYEELMETKAQMFEGDNPDFVVLWNSRNIRRKSPGDVILAYRQFCDTIEKDSAKKCALILHTQPVDQNGTDLYAVRDALCDPDYVKVYFSTEKLTAPQMNALYNIADVTMLISSNEGWGLSLTESMMTGNMIIGNVTGGMQDQMRFIDDNKEWYTPSPEIPSNHMATYLEHGEWAVPVFPSNISLAGSVPTPYIFDDRCDFRDVAQAIKEVYELPKEERERRGMTGRDWATSDESGMSARMMCSNLIDSVEQCFENFTPRSQYDLIQIETLESKYVPHSIVY